MQETPVRFLGWEDPLEKGKATHSSILAWRIPWTVLVHAVTKSWTWLSNFHLLSLWFHSPLWTLWVSQTPVRRTGGQGAVSALPGVPGMGLWRIRHWRSTGAARPWPTGGHTCPWVVVHTLWPFATTVSGDRAGFLPSLAISPLCWRVMTSPPYPLMHGQSHWQERVRRWLGSIKLKGRHWMVLKLSDPMLGCVLNPQQKISPQSFTPRTCWNDCYVSRQLTFRFSY